MKLLHTADWHIGKELGGFSLLEEQKAAFKKILQLALDEQVDGIIVAGDLYDRAIAPTSAVTALEAMLREMNLTHHLPIYAVSGNHDGATRLGAGHEWREQTNLYINTTLAEAFTPVETEEAQIFMLPFLEPTAARVYYQVAEDESADYQSIEQVMARIVPEMVANFNPDKRHILVTHYYVTGSDNEDYEFTSETNSRVGGLKGITAGQFADFDYVALGHLHLREASPTKTIRYSGSSVKFNTKEAQTEKGVYIVDVTEAGVTTSWHPIAPTKDLIVLQETFETLTDPAFYQQYERAHANFFSIRIQGAAQSSNARADLTEIYGDVVELQYDMPKIALDQQVVPEPVDDDISNEDLISQFYEEVMGESLTPMQETLVSDTLVAISQAEEG